jgi:hypothetical protein
MSEPSPKSASLPTVLAVLACFALFFLVVYYVYVPRQTGAFVGDGIRTAEQRKANLAELHAKEVKQATSYGWVDQKAGTVHLPIDRAMELTVQHYAAKK